MSEPNKTIVRQQFAESYLALEIETKGGELITFKFTSMELQSTMMLFQTICDYVPISSCDLLLCNDKHKLPLADLNTYRERQEQQRTAMLAARGGIIS